MPSKPPQPTDHRKADAAAVAWPCNTSRILRNAALLLTLWIIGIAQTAWASSVIVDQAEVTLTVAGAARAPQAVHLPYSWDKEIVTADGQAKFVAKVPIDQTAGSLALYLPRIGNTFVILVNGHELARYGGIPPGPYEDAANRPRYFNIPADWLTPQTRLEVTIAANHGRYAGLSVMTIGPTEDIRKLFAKDEFLQVDVRVVLVALTTGTGLLGLLWWMRQREIVFLYYAMGELLWAFCSVRQILPTAPLPWPLWWSVIQSSFSLACPLQCKFALIVINRDKTWVGKLTDFMLVGALPVVTYIALFDSNWLYKLWTALIVFNVFAMGCMVALAAWREPSVEKRILGIAVLFVVAGAVRDIVVLPNAYPEVSWSRFAWTGFGVSFVWVIAERMRKATQALAAMNASLSDQLAARDAELKAAFARERVAHVEHGALLERQRLMRDLHDGLGSHLVGALRMAQQTTASKDDITDHLRTAVDQLKITVDSMQDVEGDIPSLLGAIRHRLSPRLKSAGIDLQWHVEHLPVMQQWGVRQSYDLQMILFEAITNIVAHSEASCVTLSARKHAHATDAGITIEVCDNGKGMALDASPAAAGKGMASMHARAKALGAVMHIRSGPDGTCISLQLSGAGAL